MKTLLSFLLVTACLAPGQAATTISPGNHFSYGANVGWMDWRGDTSSGAVLGQFVCSGFIWAANIGWINLGAGTPANGIRYLNNSASDFGVNHDGAGTLSGYAWGANVGWITFTNRDALGALYDGPKVDLFTGKLSGLLWGANVGWINLSNAFAFVQTGTLVAGADSDGDGIPDAWELVHFGNLTTATATSDFDCDGFTDRQEYQADTDPRDAASLLRITSYAAALGGSSADITWTSRPTRQYRVLMRTDLNPGSPWSDIGLGFVLPDGGATTARHFTDSPSPQRFYRIEAAIPLGP